jgi:hypothetical protein
MLVAATTKLLFPAGQAVQEAEPRLFLYVPCGHAVHDVPSGPVVYPLLHMHEALFASGKEYAGHDEHVLDPAAELYVPGSQSAQLVEPATNEYFPAAQSEHALLPIRSAYSPAGQAVQEAPSRLFLYFPAGHAVHDVPSGPVYPSLQTGAETGTQLP